MKKFYCILLLSLTLIFSAVSAFGQVGQVTKPTQPAKPSTSKVKKPAGSSGNKTSKSNASNRSASRGQSRANASSNATAHSGSSLSVVEVTINCNAEAADVYIDNSYYGEAGKSYNIKTGPHTIQLVAEGYEDFLDNFTVTGSNRSFSFSMTKKALLSVLDFIDEMVFVHGGAFEMGSKGLEAEYDEKPAHEVILPSFYMSKYEVTQQLWVDVMGGNPSSHMGDLRPVESVSWEDCQLFISRLNALTGVKFRLPTEAEWEYAARGGNMSKDFKYAGSDSINDVAWYGALEVDSHDVGGKQPNELGLYDMSGNVMEWCSDWHGSYIAGRQKNPTGAQSGEYRVVRGGCWQSDPNHCTVTYRFPIPPEEVNETIGFRLVAKTLKTKQNKR